MGCLHYCVGERLGFFPFAGWRFEGSIAEHEQTESWLGRPVQKGIGEDVRRRLPDPGPATTTGSEWAIKAGHDL